MSRASPTLFVMVGLPTSGKTTRAKELEEERRALRLTPDEWMIPLFNHSDADGKRIVLEGRFVWLALRALRRDIDVVLDFGVWARVERSALRALAVEAGAECVFEYLAIDDVEERRRRDLRAVERPASSFYISDDDLAEYRRTFEPPDELELTGGELDSPPPGYDSWRSWAGEWWPTSMY